MATNMASALRPSDRWTVLTAVAVTLAAVWPGILRAQASNAHPSVSPDGTRIVFDSDRTGNGDIYVMNADGTAVTRLTDTAAMDMGAEWWDGGRTIVFARYEAGSHPVSYVMDPDGGNLRPMQDPRQIHWSWSRDRSMVLTGPLEDSEPSFIWVQSEDGTNRRLLAEFRPGSFNSDMSFSPDGRLVLYESFIETMSNAGVYVVDLSGGVPRRLATGTDPSWSADGSRIAFKLHDAETDRYWLHVMNADGSNDRILAEGTIPRWFPDSRRIAYMAPADGGWQIDVVDVISGEITRLTGGGFAAQSR